MASASRAVGPLAGGTDSQTCRSSMQSKRILPKRLRNGPEGGAAEQSPGGKAPYAPQPSRAARWMANANAETGKSPSASTADRRTFAVRRKPGDCFFIGRLFHKNVPIPHHTVYRPMPPRFECSGKIGTRFQPRPPILSRMSHLVDKLPHLLSTIRARIQESQRRTNDSQARDEPSEGAASFITLCGPARPNGLYKAPGGKGRAELRRFG